MNLTGLSNYRRLRPRRPCRPLPSPYPRLEISSVHPAANPRPPPGREPGFSGPPPSGGTSFMARKTTYTAYLRTDIDVAETDITARSPQEALAQARAIAADDDRRDQLYFEAYTGRF